MELRIVSSADIFHALERALPRTLLDQVSAAGSPLLEFF
jgi:hypothetical protein